MTDLLPAGVTFQSFTATQGSYDEPTGVWTVGTVGVPHPLQDRRQRLAGQTPVEEHQLRRMLRAA